MPIPKHFELRIPVLMYLKTHGAAGSKNMELPLSKQFGLTIEEVNQMYESGNGPVFKDRISWALTYLGIADLVKRIGRGLYELTPQGRNLLNTPDLINEYIEAEVKKRDQAKKEDNSFETQDFIPWITEQLTPQEELSQSYMNIKESVCDEILEMILIKTPTEFEKLVVKLLNKMGYGGKIKDSAFVTQRTNDKGIDGIIKEDELGLGKIHIQAKRYRDKAVGREEVQKFVGALMGAQSGKGVFITTSTFNKNAIEYIKTLNSSSTIVLIDGKKLAEYIYEFNLGMQTEQTFEIKILDNDFWNSMQDDPIV